MNIRPNPSKILIKLIKPQNFSDIIIPISSCPWSSPRKIMVPVSMMMTAMILVIIKKCYFTVTQQTKITLRLFSEGAEIT